MAKAFNQLKTVKLSPQDKLTFGKYKDCRVCDVWDDFDYFLWLSKQKPALFSKECKDKFSCFKAKDSLARWKLEEVKPYLEPEPDYGSEYPRKVYYADGSSDTYFGGPCGPIHCDRNGDD